MFLLLIYQQRTSTSVWRTVGEDEFGVCYQVFRDDCLRADVLQRFHRVYSTRQLLRSDEVGRPDNSEVLRVHVRRPVMHGHA
jgi:hypothetical protein